MPLPLLGLAGLGISAAGTALGAIGQSNANKANREMAREQMAFQERMRNTSYQSAVKDMQAAGLNPALAYQQGGASAPSGASAHMENTMGEVGRNSAAAVQSLANIQLTKAQAEKTGAEARMVETQTRAQMALWQAQMRQTQMNTAQAVQALRFGEDTYEGRARQEWYKGKQAQTDWERAFNSMEPWLKGLDLQNQQSQVNIKTGQYGLAEAKAMSDFFNRWGSGVPTISTASDVLKVFMPLIMRALK